MTQWIFGRAYRIGAQPYRPGDVIELDDLAARDINRDEPGTLEPLTSPPPPPRGGEGSSFPTGEERMIEAPMQDRMVRSSKKRSRKR